VGHVKASIQTVAQTSRCITDSVRSVRHSKNPTGGGRNGPGKSRVHVNLSEVNAATVNSPYQGVKDFWKQTQLASLSDLNSSVRDQNANPTRATTVRGCKKCVPLNVDKKL